MPFDFFRRGQPDRAASSVDSVVLEDSKSRRRRKGRGARESERVCVREGVRYVVCVSRKEGLGWECGRLSWETFFFFFPSVTWGFFLAGKQKGNQKEKRKKSNE